MEENVTVVIGADTAPFQTALKQLDQLAKSFGSQMTGALKDAVVSGKELDDILRQLAMNMAGMALDQGLKPLQGALSSAFSSLFAGVTPFAKGGVPGSVTPFASGGIVSAPTYFPMGGGAGLMGEAGSEAILPLRRGADGKLGVDAGQGGAAPVSITFNVSATAAASFRRSEDQVSAMLARAVSRGMRRM